MSSARHKKRKQLCKGKTEQKVDLTTHRGQRVEQNLRELHRALEVNGRQRGGKRQAVVGAGAAAACLQQAALRRKRALHLKLPATRATRAVPARLACAATMLHFCSAGSLHHIHTRGHLIGSVAKRKRVSCAGYGGIRDTHAAQVLGGLCTIHTHIQAI